jgi:hypothetical protein
MKFLAQDLPSPRAIQETPIPGKKQDPLIDCTWITKRAVCRHYWTSDTFGKLR